MKDNIININLETSTAPLVTEVRGKEWISYGDATGEWSNLYPQFLIDLYYSSSISAAIINATAEMISGKDIIIEDEEDRDLEARVKLQHFLDRANSNETLHEVLVKASFDFKLQGGFALNIVWSKDRTQIAEVYHIDVSKIRCARPDELGKTTGYYVSTDWSNTRQNKPYYVPAFNTNDRTSPNQILYSGLYSPNMNSYYIPDYVSCNNWSLLDARISEFHLNNVSSGFSGSFMVNFSNGIPTQEERFQIEQSLADKFTGQNNAGKFILTFSDDKTRTPEIQAITPSDLDKQYLALQELLTSNICSGHRITSKTLMGLDSKNGFSSNADELNSAANFYHNTVIVGFQNQILKVLHKIFKVNNMDMPVQFVQLKPITTKFTNQDLAAVLTPNEIREEMGYEPLDVDVEVREDLSKTNKFTALESFLDTLEDIPDDWELVEEEIVDGEHQDFDFEETLNQLANDKIELASTGIARPNAKTPTRKKDEDGKWGKNVDEDGKPINQDGVDKNFNNYYRVRYVYANDNFLINKSGTHREFCTKMSLANKLYRKQDIINMSEMAVNPGFGEYGSDYYSIWKFKGGPQCFHFWSRRIFKTSLRNAKQPISDSELIGYTKAKSEGFTAKKNDNLVATPPRRMANNGYLNPR